MASTRRSNPGPPYWWDAPAARDAARRPRRGVAAVLIRHSRPKNWPRCLPVLQHSLRARESVPAEEFFHAGSRSRRGGLHWSVVAGPGLLFRRSRLRRPLPFLVWLLP